MGEEFELKEEVEVVEPGLEEEKAVEEEVEPEKFEALEPELEVGEEFELKEEVEAVEPGLEEEEGFDLPSDFDMGMLDLKEGPPEEIVKLTKVEGEEAIEEEIPGMEAEEEKEEEIAEMEAEEEKEEVVEEALEEFEMPDLEEIETLEKAEGPPPLEEVKELLPELEEEPTPETLEEKEPFEAPVGLEELKIPEIEEEELLVVEEKAIEEEAPVKREGEEVLPHLEEEIEEEVIPAEEKKEAAARVIDIELSDEDIVLITAKLKQIDPHLATQIRDIIVGVTLPEDSIKGLIELLVSDAPEEEIIRYVERATGKKVVPRIRIPEVITVPRKPTALETIIQNIGPLVRVAALSVVILAILSTIFMVFIYRPIKAGRYYREGIVYIRNEDYAGAEESFRNAIRIYEKVKEYDTFGWEYMLSGNYDKAMEKFTAGIAKDEGVKNLDIRLHLAKLYNVLGKYEKADELYDIVTDKKPGIYTYNKLKGENLIDWGKLEAGYLDPAYSLFKEEFSKNPKSSDPLFQMLYIHLLKNDVENINYLYTFLNENYPKEVDKDVFTELASFYINNEQIDPVRKILEDVLNGYPDYPKAYYAFAQYYKVIKNKRLEEEMLKHAIKFENKRKLEYPWDTRNRALLSNAYNDLGEIYAGLEIPGMSAEAINYFKQAIEENEKNKKVYFNLAQVYFYGEKNYDLARTYYEKAKLMGYENNDLNYNLGILYFYKKMFKKALSQWSKLSETMPDNPNISFAMGSSLLHLGEYSSALGEFLMLEELYDDLVASLGEIKPWRAYHKRIILEASAVNNNLGVAYQKLYETTKNPEYQKYSLVSLYKAAELADIMGIEKGEIQYNINYIVHPEVIRGDMAINNNTSDNYRFVTQ